jgi:hypothetical protein
MAATRLAPMRVARASSSVANSRLRKSLRNGPRAAASLEGLRTGPGLGERARVDLDLDVQLGFLVGQANGDFNAIGAHDLRADGWCCFRSDARLWWCRIRCTGAVLGCGCVIELISLDAELGASGVAYKRGDAIDIDTGPGGV